MPAKSRSVESSVSNSSSLHLRFSVGGGGGCGMDRFLSSPLYVFSSAAFSGNCKA